MTAPMPYRCSSNSQQYIGSFPPPIYYRDTYGLQHLSDTAHPVHRRFTDSVTTVESDDTATTKSTVRTTINIQNPNLMIDSSTSKGTAMTQSFHVEQMVTNQVLLSNARTLLTLCLVAFGSALQLIVFAIICLFYDGCPYYCAIVGSFLFMFNAAVTLYFICYKPTRIFLLFCILCSSVCFIVSVALFIWTAYLVYGEDKKIRGQGWSYYEENLLETNRIVTNTRIAMYSLHMVLTPVQALCCAGILWILYRNLRAIQDDTITKGFFFSQPTLGHQTVLVPIELKQVGSLDESEPDNASIGVQTSGNQSNKDATLS